MSFLDSLENNLKSLESQDERDPARAAEMQRKRAAERDRVKAAAPFADQLKNGPFTTALLDHATRIGFGKRMKVQIIWLDSTLRLQARDRKLDLVPTPEGVEATFSENDEVKASRIVDLNGDAEALATEWLSDSAQ